MSRAVLSVDAGSPVNWSVGALEAVFAWGRPTGPSFTGSACCCFSPEQPSIPSPGQASLFKEFPDPFKVHDQMLLAPDSGPGFKLLQPGSRTSALPTATRAWLQQAGNRTGGGLCVWDSWVMMLCVCSTKTHTDPQPTHCGSLPQSQCPRAGYLSAGWRPSTNCLHL